ncbi:MAG: ATP-binding cassette domain-containing protein [Lachnospiraceae bacterium]|nr:ATP-binding cassette domain-containing protein [Lachnospiraceae bacterium]
MIIEVNNYTKTIRRNNVLNKISFTFHGGKIYGLSGKNGCGKTMLMRAVSGLILPSSGFVEVDKKRIGRDISFPESVGLLLENPSFPGDYTGRDNLELLNKIRREDIDYDSLLDSVGLDHNDQRKYRRYSLGMKQRLGIAAAIMGQPSLILLDEPINAIDEIGVELIKKTILSLKNEDRIIIIACHDMDEMRLFADDIIYMSEGEIVKVESLE